MLKENFDQCLHAWHFFLIMNGGSWKKLSQSSERHRVVTATSDLVLYTDPGVQESQRDLGRYIAA